jgi:hypothetical protein
MTQRTLLTRVYHAGQLKQIERLLKLNFEGLDVDVKVEGVEADRWVKVSLSGEDEAIATSYVRREFGFCPESLANVERFATVKGYVLNPAKNPDALHVDIGVFRPETVYAIAPLRHLQAALADGRKLALKKIAELFGFCEGLPLSLKIIEVKTAEKQMDAEFATEQLERFIIWRESMLDRLIVLGSPFHEVKKTLNYTGLSRDIISIEPLGMFEHALTCKLGTDAAGLISQVGRKLRNARFAVFNPRKIREFLSPQETMQ